MNEGEEITDIVQTYKEKVKVGYQNEETEEIISINDFTNQLEELREELSYVDDYENHIFKSLEDEYKFRKFKESFSPAYDYKEEIITIEFTVIDISQLKENNEYEMQFIKPIGDIDRMFNITSESYFVYYRSPYRMALDIAEKLGMKLIDDNDWTTELTNNLPICWSIPNHSKNTLRFLKINNSYAHQAYSDEHFKRKVVGDLETVMAAVKADYELIEGVFKTHLAKAKQKSINEDNLGDLIIWMEKLYNNVTKIDSKVATYEKQRNVEQTITKKIKELKTLL